MDIEALVSLDMPLKPEGSILCLSRSLIAKILECIIACIVFVSLVYLVLLLLNSLVGQNKFDPIYTTVGYISLITIFSVPIGYYGSCNGSPKALLLYYLLAAYHAYALIIYLWINIRFEYFYNDQDSNPKSGGLMLHLVSTGAYTSAVIASLLAASTRIISNTSSNDSPGVIVNDNTSLD